MCLEMLAGVCFRFALLALQYSIHVTLHSLSFRNDSSTPASQPQNRRHSRNCIRGRKCLFLRSPQETDEQYAGSINNLFVHENFAELEKIEQRNRIEKGRVAGGIWKSSSFFTAIALPRGEEIKDSDYDFRLSIAKKWVAAYPGSATARVALADIYTAYADSARGTGHADSVSDANWKLFYSRVAQAKQVLLEAAAMKDKDAHWFDVMMQVSNGEGWDPPQERELFDQAIAFEPSYYASVVWPAR